MKVKFLISAYLIFLIMCCGIAFLYLANLDNVQPVSELIAITGPMPLVYLLATMNWVGLYFWVCFVSVVITGALWVSAGIRPGVPRYFAATGAFVLWLLSGFFSLGISYYG